MIHLKALPTWLVLPDCRYLQVQPKIDKMIQLREKLQYFFKHNEILNLFIINGHKCFVIHLSFLWFSTTFLKNASFSFTKFPNSSLLERLLISAVQSTVDVRKTMIKWNESIQYTAYLNFIRNKWHLLPFKYL